MARFSSSSSVEELPRQHQVFINFYGEELRLGFVSHLAEALISNGINVYYNMDESICPRLEILLERIEESSIAVVIFSRKYTESTWCLRELAIIKDCVGKGKLVAIAIFYKLDPSTVTGLRGQFGDAFKDLREKNATMETWEKALKSISDIVC